MAKVIYPRNKIKPPYLVSTWGVEDVHAEAHDHNLECTHEQAVTVLEQVAHGHDAECGINWEVLEWHIRDVLDKNKTD